MQKTLARTLLVSALVLGVVPVAAAATAVKNKDTFVLAVTGQPSTLDPAFAYDSASGEIIFEVYDSLIAYKGASTDKFIPMLSTAVPEVGNGISADGLTYTFPIRKGVKFQDGSKMTPEDVEYTFERSMLASPAGGPQWMLLEPLFAKQSLFEIVGAKATDATKLTAEQIEAIYNKVDKAVEVKGDDVIFHLAKPYAPFLNILSHGGSWASITSKAYTIAKGGWDGKVGTWAKYYDQPTDKGALFENAMGTGAYKLVKWDRSGQQILLERNDNYFRGAAKIKNVVVKYIAELNTRKLMLQQGDADAINVSVADASKVADLEEVTVRKQVPQNTVAFFVFNQGIDMTSNEYVGSGKLDGNGVPANFFADLNVRKAFTFAFDHKTYVNQALAGLSGIPTDFMPGTMKYSSKKTMYSFNLKKAEEYMKKAFGGELWEKGFQFTLVYNSGNTNRQIACEMLKANLAKLNPKFKVEVRNITWAQVLELRKQGRMPLYLMGWHNDFPDAHNFAMPLLHSEGDYMPFAGKPAIDTAKKLFDPLIDKGIGEIDSKKRQAIYTELHDLVVEHAPILLTLDQKVLKVHRDWLKGTSLNVMWPGEGYYFWNLRK